MTKISSFSQYVGNKMNHTAKNWFANALEKGYQHPTEYAAKMMVWSLITKDAVNCGFYTYQSATNEKIPEDKRGFVAALDLVNGIINVGGQIGAFALVDRFLTPWLQGKYYTGVFKDQKTNTEKFMRSDAPLSADVIYQDIEHVIGTKSTEIKEELKNAKDCKITYDDVAKNIKNISEDIIKKIGHSGTKGKDITTGVGIVVTALATTALIKRTLTPLIATPLAGALNNKYNHKKTEAPNDKMLEATYKPWLTKAPDTQNYLTQDKFQKSTPKQA